MFATMISVIVPVYNVEPYLRKCLDSIVYQTYKNLEILVVDDGSTDECGRICDEYEEKDELAPKQLLDINDYEVISFPGFIRQPTRYKNGKLKPLSEWKSGIGSEGTEIKIKNKLNFKKKFIPIESEHYYCVFSIQDVHGKIHMSDFIEMTF